MWYCRAAPDRDEAKFEALLAQMRKEYASPTFNPEISIFDDHTCRGLTSYPFPERFTPDGLLRYASVIRGPFTSNGRLTLGGRSRAKFLLCRERMLAGTVTNREPDWSAIKDHLPPSLYEIKVRAGNSKGEKLLTALMTMAASSAERNWPCASFAVMSPQLNKISATRPELPLRA